MNLKEHTTISGFKLHQSNISDASLIFARVWLERGDAFWFWNASLKLCPRPWVKAACRIGMACSCTATKVHWPWGSPAVSSLQLKQCFHFFLGS